MIGTGVQLVIGEVVLLADHRHRLRAPFHLRLKELMETLLLRIRHLGGIPLHQQLAALLLRQEGQVRQASRRIGDDPL